LISLDLERGRDFGEPSYNRFRQLCGLNQAKTFNDFTDQMNKKVNTTFQYCDALSTDWLIIRKYFSQDADALADLYENVDDVDYFAAGLLEKSKPGAMLGHTFQCVVGEMFFRWKFGDRFFYEFGNQPGSFTPGKWHAERFSYTIQPNGSYNIVFFSRCNVVFNNLEMQYSGYMYKLVDYTNCIIIIFFCWKDQLKEIRKSTLALIVCMTSNIVSIQRDAFYIPSSQ